ncbi:lytic polysaccharide monooxygenase [Streptomyces sp. NPDC002386]
MYVSCICQLPRPVLRGRPRLPHPARGRGLFLVVLALLTALPALCLMLAVGIPAVAHGTPVKPGSRTFLCRRDGLTGTGEIRPVNPACEAARQTGGTTPFYNWFAVLRPDGAGRTRGFVPDGRLCSGGNPDFLTVDHPPPNGTPRTVDAHCSWSGRLPSGKTGRHIVHMVWQRSDSAETFQSCSDVAFDGGDGEVTGVHDPGGPGELPPGACTATRRTTGTWSDGYRSEVTVTNTGTVPMLGWMAGFTLPAGRSVAGLWNGDATNTGQDVMVHNAGWNGSLSPGRSATFGYVVRGSGADDPTGLSCQVG